jgi:hypothetical protein
MESAKRSQQTDIDSAWAGTMPLGLESVPSDAQSASDSYEQASLRERLSDRLLADFSPPAWREVFVGNSDSGVRFTKGPMTLLATTCISSEWSEEQLAALARNYSGELEALSPRPFFSFAEAHHALDVAMLLQRACGRRLRVALVTAECDQAVFTPASSLRRLTLGDAVARVIQSVDAVSAGSIHLCGSTFDRLSACIEWQTRAAVLTTEVADGAVTSACITLPPAPRADLSTFAGLGLS